jgi:TRAP-type mannitol/chloroaromatic compound transport system permease small subunit
VSYGATQEWDQALIRLGMPLSFLLPMVGAMMVVIGWAMLSQSLAEGRDRRIGRHVRPSPGRWRGVSREPK